MTALAFSRASKECPTPWTVDHPGSGPVGYTCHMAALHWAQMALGASHAEANAIVSDYARRHCLGCTGNGNHSSIRMEIYGPDFCRKARLIPGRDALFGMVNVGDVLITGHPRTPTHTMVVRQHRGPDHVTVRGFNNHGTLGTGERDRYDPVSHNITQDKYWPKPLRASEDDPAPATGGFGQYRAPLYVIPHADFMAVSRAIRR